MAREDPHFRLRLPADLKARVEEAARASGRSINAEIVQRLEASFGAPSVTPEALTAATHAIMTSPDFFKGLWDSLRQQGWIPPEAILEKMVAKTTKKP